MTLSDFAAFMATTVLGTGLVVISLLAIIALLKAAWFTLDWLINGGD